MLSVFYHPGYAAPIGEHIMPIRKFALIADRLLALPFVTLLDPRPISEADLLRVHTPSYINAIRNGQPRELAESNKFPWSPQLFPSVLLTNGGVLAAAERALIEGSAAALASGFHHAHADHGEGFCTFNGLIVAVDTLRAAGRIQSAAVLDCDLHYGNGTASLATTRPYLNAVSIYGNDYNGNQAFRDVNVLHHTDGVNHQSIALPNRSGRRELLAALDRAFPLLTAGGKPDVLLYQAGADPYFEDPYSPLTLDYVDLQLRDQKVFEFAKAEKIPIAWVLAGGYTPDVSKVVQVHVNTFHAWKDVFAA